jgi:hypothetical protein
MQAIRNRSAFAEVPEKCRKAHRRRPILSGRGGAFLMPVFLKTAGTPTGCYGNGRSPGMKKREKFTSVFATSNDYISVRGIRTPEEQNDSVTQRRKRKCRNQREL